jgi:hypothetical protein
MSYRGNDFDVSSKFNTTDPKVVNAEVDRIYLELYPSAPTRLLDNAFSDLTRLYRGEYPGYHQCDTAYHDMQHVLDVTLAMARLIDGYERTRIGTESFGDSLFRLGVITALFHDMGYVRELNDHAHKNGAEYTLTHVSRGSVFLKDYLPRIGMAEMADIAAELIHFTGYEMPVSKIKVPSLTYKLLGSMLGSADIIAQMSDRCYLEKCRDRLYPEFVAGGLATKRTPEGTEQVVFSSGEDLVIKTPAFFEGAAKRLNDDLGGCYNYAENHFGGQNLYLDEVGKNVNFAHEIGSETTDSTLKRRPPKTLTPFT